MALCIETCKLSLDPLSTEIFMQGVPHTFCTPLFLTRLWYLVESPSSHAVSVFPSNPVAFIGREEYIFRCLLVTARTDRLLNVTWFLNETTLESLDLRDVTPYFEIVGNGLGTLIFRTLLLKYNYTTIQCQGQLQSGMNPISEGVTLLLQGMFLSMEKK